MDQYENTFQLTQDSLLPSKLLSSEENWRALAKAKTDFIERGVDPHENPIVRQEVADSWVRSRDMKVDCYALHSAKAITDQKAINHIVDKNRLLMDMAMPIITTHEKTVKESGFVFTLFDNSGVLLCKEGKESTVSLFDLRCFNLYDEASVGTCAHNLTIRFKKPFQLIGPENWMMGMGKTVCTAVPVLGVKDDLLGVLTLVIELGESTPWVIGANNMHGHTLAWLCSMSGAITAQMRLRNRAEKISQLNLALETANQAMSTTLDFIDEAILLVDCYGRFIHINYEAIRILKINPDKISSYHLSDFVKNVAFLKQILSGKQHIDYAEERLTINREERTYLISSRPVFDATNETACQTVLRINNVDTINALATSRTISTSKFNFSDIVGESDKMKSACNMARHFATIPENVLLLGESGTGKELFAQAIHNNSGLSGAFIAVNCSVLPRELIESELFGYVGGSFTGADKKGRPGKIELAHNGTLFLDEIGDMPIELQSVLLRVLQDKKVMRVGGSEYKRVNFRLIAATNRDLQDSVQHGLFREDLYFRLAVFIVHIPPLRNRGHDILLLTEYFIRQYANKMHWPIPRLTDAVKDFLLSYNWPGNVRQLENAIVYVMNMLMISGEGCIQLSHFNGFITTSENSQSHDFNRNTISVAPALTQSEESPARDIPPSTISSLEDGEKAALINALKATDNNVTAAAKMLHIGRTTMYRKMQQHDIIKIKKK